MVVSVQHFTEMVNGYEKTTSGLWTHKGKLNTRTLAVSDTATVSSSLTANGQIVAANAAPRISDVGYSDGHLQLMQQTPSEPRIGFHEAGSQGLALYKPAGQYDLRIRTNAGLDWPIGGRVLLNTTINWGWSTTSVGSWLNTNVSASVAVRGRMLRVTYVGAYTHSATGAIFLLGLGINGSIQSNVPFVITNPLANAICPVNWTVFATPAAGAVTVTVMANSQTAGTLQQSNWINNLFTIEEAGA